MKIQALCPAGLVTGGAEAIHQFTHVARSQGYDVRIVYTSRKGVAPNAPVPDVYSCYDVVIDSEIEDLPTSFVLIPETETKRLSKIKLAKKGIWWLSVDNYIYMANQWRRKRLKRFFGIDVPFNVDRPSPRVLHLVQSAYAHKFLLDRQIYSGFLTDFLRDDFMNQLDVLTGNRLPRVAYNPKKGYEYTQKIIQEAKGSFEFVALENMTPSEVIDTLKSSMVYVDFGLHPGRDRIPREAVMCGCCILTGLRGSAANGVDVPIPERFKIDQDQSDFGCKAVGALAELINDFGNMRLEFDGYRAEVLNQKSQFYKEVAAACEMIGMEKNQA